MSEKLYYCQKCGHNHRYDSKIGTIHLQFKSSLSDSQIKPTLIEDIQVSESESTRTKNVKSSRSTGFIKGYIESYRDGVKKFGIWWKIFQLSIWAFALIFLLTAAIIFVIYLPKIEMIYWDLL